jgi:hypothetical protein
MMPQDIPAAEQLMGLTSQPTVDPNMEFLMKGLIWPAREALESQSDRAALADAGLVEDTIAWIGHVLKPDLVAADLRSRLRAARSIVNGQDAFLARYRLEGHSIQIVVTRFHLHLVIAPGGDQPLEALHRLLQVDQSGEAPWSGSWQTGQVDQLTYGYQPRGSVADWRETLLYVANGRAAKFSLQKIPILPPGSGGVKGFVANTEEAERHWFPRQQ